MKPIKQTIPHDPDNNQYGNCMQACLASLLELPINDVPHLFKDGTNDDWMQQLNEWLSQLGLAYIEVSDDLDVKLYKNTYHIMCGKSPRSPVYHAVIAKGGKIVFDPHPDNTNILYDWGVFYGFIIKNN